MKFELNRLHNYDDESLLGEIRRVAKLIETPWISATEFDKYSKAASSTIRRRFGGWKNALEKAGLGHRYGGTTVNEKQRAQENRGISDEDLIADLQRVAALNKEKNLTIEIYNLHGKVSGETIRRRFGSWWDGLKKAGLEISNLGKRYSENDYWENLLAVWTYCGRQPTYSDMSLPPSVIKAKSYEARWGTWRKALSAFIEYANTEVDERDKQAEKKDQNSSFIEETAKPAIKKENKCKREIAAEDRREIPKSLRFKVLTRDDFKCVLCGNNPPVSPGLVLHIDHIVPWSKGGKTVIDNLRTLCADCNVGRGNRYMD